MGISDVRAKMHELRNAPATRDVAVELDDDELGGIVMYTHDNCTGVRDGNFYFEENSDLRQYDLRARMKMLQTWGSHIYYTLRGLSKLNDIQSTTYRGLSGQKDFVSSEYALHRMIQFGGWTSTAVSLSNAKDFVG